MGTRAAAAHKWRPSTARPPNRTSVFPGVGRLTTVSHMTTTLPCWGPSLAHAASGMSKAIHADLKIGTLMGRGGWRALYRSLFAGVLLPRRPRTLRLLLFACFESNCASLWCPLQHVNLNGHSGTATTTSRSLRTYALHIGPVYCPGCSL